MYRAKSYGVVKIKIISKIEPFVIKYSDSIEMSLNQSAYFLFQLSNPIKYTASIFYYHVKNMSNYFDFFVDKLFNEFSLNGTAITDKLADKDLLFTEGVG